MTNISSIQFTQILIFSGFIWILRVQKLKKMNTAPLVWFSVYMNKLTKILIGIVIVGFAVWGIFTASNNNNEQTRIGVILPLSGQYAALGESDRNAMMLAKEELKAENIELYFEDDAYDAKKAVSAYHKLKSIHDIDAVIVLSAPSIESIAPLTNADNIPLLGLGGTIVYKKDTVFQLMPSGNLLFPTLGQEYGKLYKKIAVAHSNAPLFAENTRMFRTGLPSDVEAPDFVINPGLDYRTEVQKILATKPDAITLFMPKEDAIKFLKALRVQDGKAEVEIVCDFGVEIAVAEYTEAIGKDRLEGCLSTNLADTAKKDFKERYKATYGSEMQITADYAYDSVQLVSELSKTTQKEKWVEYLSEPDFSFKGNASGEIKFNEDGTRLDLPPTIHIYKDGTFVPYVN